MDFDSPDVMKTFPGLYAPDHHKKGGNESDYSDENEKTMKKDLLSTKKKEKKDKKDKERGYAALEGESSGEDNGTAKSPSKSKKSKSFKFTTKSKEKQREKSREKDIVDVKKEKDKKSERKLEKEKSKGEKSKKVKHSVDEQCDIADVLPIFGVHIENAVEFGKCHDGIDIPLPVRECVDYIEVNGINFEGVYKVSGTKSKALHLKKLYNQRQNVVLGEYDIPTVCSVLKMFLRDLPEPLFTNELLIRFEEAGAILTTNTREKHLKILMEHLSSLNRLILGWVVVHLANISNNEKVNKMNRHALAGAFHHSLHCSIRLLEMLLLHSEALFPDIIIEPYIPPLPCASILPEDPKAIERELGKQESLLDQIHKEMNSGCISKQREELLWEVQRIITQLKRTLKNVNKDKESLAEKKTEEKAESKVTDEKVETIEISKVEDVVDNVEKSVDEFSEEAEVPCDKSEDMQTPTNEFENKEKLSPVEDIAPSSIQSSKEKYLSDNLIELMMKKNKRLTALKESLMNDIKKECLEIESLKAQIDATKQVVIPVPNTENSELEKVMELLQQENQMLRVKKINLVRQIVEQREICIDLKSKMEILDGHSTAL